MTNLHMPIQSLPPLPTANLCLLGWGLRWPAPCKAAPPTEQRSKGESSTFHGLYVTI